MNEWIGELARLAADEVPCVVITLLRARGSAPRESGAKMIVTARQAHGTLGGGTVELKAQQYARTLLEGGDPAPQVHEFALSAELDQACGGRVQLLFEPVLPAAFHIALFGAGHVGRALVHVLEGVSCRICWVDARDGQFPDNVPPGVRASVSPEPETEVASLPAGSYVLAMTHSHEADYRIMDAALARSDLAFVGMIGSRSKRARFLKRLRQAGRPQAESRLVCPIGVAGVGGKQPAEIAIAVAAQLLQHRGAVQDGASRAETAKTGVS